MELRVGTGGWAYFQVPGMDSLQAYARAFDYVEVNTTFYQVPPPDMVASWRRRAPPNFAFSVRCHRGVTHAHALDPSARAVELLERMADIARVLEAEALHLQTPGGFTYGPAEVARLADLLDAASLEGIPLVLEPRGHAQESLPPDLRALMEDRGIVHCVDLSKERPQVESDLLYTRLFGKGYHTVYQFSDPELAEIHARGREGDHRKALFTFHGIRMYSDAGRFLRYAREGAFPSAVEAGQGRLPGGRSEKL